jgi:hypothetical protein
MHDRLRGRRRFDSEFRGEDQFQPAQAPGKTGPVGEFAIGAQAELRDRFVSRVAIGPGIGKFARD